MTQTLKNLLTLVVFVILVALGYYMFTQRDAASLSLVGGETVTADLLQKTQVFIERRAILDEIKLDTSLFTNSVFTSLRSYSTEVPDQTVGRTNIFEIPVPLPVTSPISVE